MADKDRSDSPLQRALKIEDSVAPFILLPSWETAIAAWKYVSERSERTGMLLQLLYGIEGDKPKPLETSARALSIAPYSAKRLHEKGLETMRAYVRCEWVRMRDAKHREYIRDAQLETYFGITDYRWGGTKEQVADFIAELRLKNASTQLINCVKAEGHHSFKSFASRTRKELLRIPNCGKRCVEEIEKLLKKEGMRLREKSDDL